MRWGIGGQPVPVQLRYSGEIQRACDEQNFPPLFAYAVAYRESISGEIAGRWNAATVIAPDNGHGLFQLTSWWPDPGWDDPYTNAHFAIKDWLAVDAPRWFRDAALTGDDLVRAAAASFNAGWSGAWAGHLQGNVDLHTTDNYGAGVLKIYQNLVAHGTPT